MARSKRLSITPHGSQARAFPAGDFIREELDARGWTQRDLAEIIGLPIQVNNAIVNTKVDVGRRSLVERSRVTSPALCPRLIPPARTPGRRSVIPLGSRPEELREPGPRPNLSQPSCASPIGVRQPRQRRSVIALRQPAECLLDLGRVRAIQRRFAHNSPTLVDQRQQSRPGRGREARAPHDLKRVTRIENVRVGDSRPGRHIGH
jgi:hypothetical protein